MNKGMLSEKTTKNQKLNSKNREKERQSKMLNKAELENIIYSPGIKKLQKTLPILTKLFLKEKFTSSDFELSDVERSLVTCVVLKKFGPSFDIEFNPKCFNKIARISLMKQNEDGVKFIYKKVLRQLKKKFKTTILTRTEQIMLSKNEINAKFYLHYFGDHFDELEIDVRNENLINLTKTFFEKGITLKFLRKLAVNQEFIQSAKSYMEDGFLKDFKNLNKSKIKKLIIKWEGMFEKMFEKEAVKLINFQVNSRGNKIPWTICEVKKSLSYMIKFFKRLQSKI